MSAAAEFEAGAHAPAPEESRGTRRLVDQLLRYPGHVWKLLVGGVLCQSLVGGVVATGWTYRLMQRNVVRRWCRVAAKEGLDVEAAARLREARVKWPNWLMSQEPPHGQAGGRTGDADASAACGVASQGSRAVTSASGGDTERALPLGALRQRAGKGVRRLFASLWANLRIGVQAVFNTWVLTAPGVALWAFSWYAGWMNSFNKGYEQAWVGPTTGVAGIALFIAAMLYVPMAQARQAATGRWRAFYQFRLVWRLIRRRWLMMAVLAGCYSLASIVVAGYKTAPYFFPQAGMDVAGMTPQEQLAVLNSHFFYAAIIGFLLFVALRLAAARVYAGAMLEAVREGDVASDRLYAGERRVLAALGLADMRPRDAGHPVFRVVKKTTRPPVRVALGALAAALWFTFVAQIYVSEFLNYHGVRGWVNQPLVHAPWFRYVPGHLVEAAEAAEAAEEGGPPAG
jgi:hypothetical protein